MTEIVAPREFCNDGGPLLVLPGAAVAHWEGIDAPSNGRVVEASFRWSAAELSATDYDRACDVSARTAAVIRVGPSWGIVLGTETAGSALWIHGPAPHETCLVAVGRADDVGEPRLAQVAAGQPAAAWDTLLERVRLGGDGLLLAHAADRPADVRELSAFAPVVDGEAARAVIGEGIRCHLPEGEYGVSGCDVATSEGEYLTFVKFTLLDDAA
ncbi:MAG: immunity 21 family protein [Gemmatimonadetes bacterium]|nr:immunity 21 family protein [Gemmatimonadota bacterium]